MSKKAGLLFKHHSHKTRESGHGRRLRTRTEGMEFSGAMGELAFALSVGGNVDNTPPYEATWRPRWKKPDVCGYGVRTTRYPSGALWCNERDIEDQRLVLVMDRDPYYYICGFASVGKIRVDGTRVDKGEGKMDSFYLGQTGLVWVVSPTSRVRSRGWRS
ncbi:MAG: hypothetical protein ACYS30_26225 [Planctomycetota bacterium]